MPEQTSLVNLAQRILKSAELLDASRLDESDNSSNLLQKFDDEIPTSLSDVRRDLISATQELQIAVSGPTEYLEQNVLHCHNLGCLKWLLRFNIFAYVPNDLSPVTYTTLANQAGVPLTRLHSVARTAMVWGLFNQPTPTTIAHNELSLSFVEDPLITYWARWIVNYVAPSASAFAEATARWGDTKVENETAYNIALGTDMPFFKHVGTVPGMVEEFAGVMRSLGRSDLLKIDHLVKGLDWKALGEDTHVIDVGGSNGQVAVALATTYPNLTSTVQELPEVVAASVSILDSLPSNTASRINFIAHDFFNPQPPLPSQVANPMVVYLFRRVIHNWHDDLARKILSHIATAIQESGRSSSSVRIIIMDTVLPPPGQIDRMLEGAARVRDLTMAHLLNSKERDLDEWKALFDSVKPKLRLKEWRQSPRSALAILDVELAE